MLYLLETPVGIALFKESEKLVLLDKIVYRESSTAQKFINAMNNISLNNNALNNDLEFPEEIENFFKKNLTESSTLNILNPEVLPLFIKKFKTNALCKPDKNFERIRTNPFKWFEINKQTYNAASLKLSQRLFDIKVTDSQIIETYRIICELEKNINNRIIRIREWYALHFPELCNVTDVVKYLKYIILIGDKATILNKYSEQGEKEDAKDSTQIDSNDTRIDNGIDTGVDIDLIDSDVELKIPDTIVHLAKNSMGVEMKKEDLEKIQETAEDILNDITQKIYLNDFLKNKCAELFPSLYILVGEILLAKLLTKAGSLLELTKMPSSTIQIIGAEKAFNEAVKNQKNTPKYGLIYESKYISKADPENKGKIARILANKITLCARVDLEKNDGDFGKSQQIKILKAMEKIENQVKGLKKPIKQQKRKYISVKEYNEAKDLKKQKKN